MLLSGLCPILSYVSVSMIVLKSASGSSKFCVPVRIYLFCSSLQLPSSKGLVPAQLDSSNVRCFFAGKGQGNTVRRQGYY